MRFHPIGGGGGAKTMDESDSDDAGAVSAHKTSMFGLLGINRLSLGPFAEFHFYTGKRWRPVGAAPPMSNDLVIDVLTSTFLKFTPLVLEIGQIRCHAES